MGGLWYENTTTSDPRLASPTDRDRREPSCGVACRVPFPVARFYLPLNPTMSQDPLLCENPGRYVLFPITHENEWWRYKQALERFWPAESLALARDAERVGVVPHAMALLCGVYAASGSGQIPQLVCLALARMMNEVQIPEVRCGFGLAISQIQIHMETLASWLQYLAPLNASIEYAVRRAQSHIESVRRWFESHVMSMEASFRSRLSNLVIFLLLVNAGATVAIKLLSSSAPSFKELLGATHLIALDRLHLVDLCAKLPGLQNPDGPVVDSVRDLVQIEQSSLDGLLEDAEVSKSARLAHIEWLADRALGMIGHQPLYNTATPFSWALHSITLPAEPTRKTSGGRVVKEEGVFSLDHDF